MQMSWQALFLPHSKWPGLGPASVNPHCTGAGINTTCGTQGQKGPGGAGPMVGPSLRCGSTCATRYDEPKPIRSANARIMMAAKEIPEVLFMAISSYSLEKA